jgi:methionine synthase I (cobalamin-dependent)
MSGASDFREALANGFVFFDGSMGALLQNTPTKTAWKLPEELNVSEPEVIEGIHDRYLAAGATVILTNTFGGTKCKLDERGLDVADIAARAVSIARRAVSKYERRFVALDIGPTGKLLEPMGNFTFDEAYEAFAEQARAGEKAGADLAVIETMSDLYELKAAVLAVKENTKLPIVASATFQDTNRTLTGADPATVVACMEGLGVDAVGFNCGERGHSRFRKRQNRLQGFAGRVRRNSGVWRRSRRASSRRLLRNDARPYRGRGEKMRRSLAAPGRQQESHGHFILERDCRLRRRPPDHRRKNQPDGQKEIQGSPAR